MQRQKGTLMETGGRQFNYSRLCFFKELLHSYLIWCLPMQKGM